MDLDNMAHIQLLAKLKPQTFAVLQIILYIYSKTKNRSQTFTLQQNYIRALTGLSSKTIVKAIDTLYNYRIIDIDGKPKQCECLRFQFNPAEYDNLVAKCDNTALTLTTCAGGRGKAVTQQKTPSEILEYMIGKSVKKSRSNRVK